ncbi:MAG: MutS-related protein [Bacillota bacterium]
MLIEERTKKLLDFDRVLAELHPVTPFGQRYKKGIRCFEQKDKQLLEDELERVWKVKELIGVQGSLFLEIKSLLRQVKDVSRSVERSMQGISLTTVELFELKNLGAIMKSLSESQLKLQWKLPVKYRVHELFWLDELLDPEHTGIKTFYLYDSYSQELSRIRNEKQQLEKQLDDSRKMLIKAIEEELSLPIRITGEIAVNKSNTQLIEKLRTHPKLQPVNETYVSTTFRLVSDENINNISMQLEKVKSEEATEECRVLELLSAKIAAHGKELLDNMNAIGEFDLLLAKAYMAIAHKAVKPVLTDNRSIIISSGRHPVVESELRKRGKSYKPISVRLDKLVTLITGANMGGKTVSLKMIGLLTLMAHYGLLVPAEYMELPLFDFIFMSAGDEQSIDLGLSTFGAEMKGMKEMLLQTEKRGLVLVDELARGTNPHEGYAISCAIIEYLLKRSCLTVITTHYDGLVREDTKHLQVNGLRNLSEDMINSPQHIAEHMDYTLIEVEANSDVPKDALKISKMLGIPTEIINRAEEIMKEK